MRKLYRSRRDSKLFGLCGGLAEYLNVDPTLLRLVVVVTAFFSAGSAIPIYIIAAIVIPKEPNLDIPPMYPPHMGPNSGAYNGGYAAYPGANIPKAAPQAHYPPQHQPYQQQQPSYGQPSTAGLDDMMKEVEKKALWKEIEELRAKVAKYEKGDK